MIGAAIAYRIMDGVLCTMMCLMLKGVSLLMTTAQTPNMTDYEAERRSFQLDVPEYFNFAADIIDRQAQNAEKEAMLWIGPHGEERHLTFAHFSAASSRAANAFSAL